MARARNIKPGFFKNEELIEVDPWARLLFIGLWTLADKRGVLEDRPKRIKMEIFPADDADVDQLLSDLEGIGVIQRYEVDGKRGIFIPGFTRHQNPHHREAESEMPMPATDQPKESPGQAPGKPRESRADSLIPESLTTTAHSGQRQEYPPEFEQMWPMYPKRHGDNPKKRAFKAWNARLREGHTAEEMTEGVQRYARWCDATGKTGLETVKQAATFLGPDKGFTEEWPTKPTGVAKQGESIGTVDY